MMDNGDSGNANLLFKAFDVSEILFMSFFLNENSRKDITLLSDG